MVSLFMEKIYGRPAAIVFTLLVLWTTFGSVFALLLGYSRIPYAAAQDGCFLKIFARLHPTKSFPHVSLLVMGGVSIVCCLLPLDVVISALITTRILVQFIGQVVAVVVLRRRSPQMARPYRIWLYPIPNLIALFGWIFIFATSGRVPILFGVLMLLLGFLFFMRWSAHTGRWPFEADASYSPGG
jgi:amino acid transporter